MSELSPPDVYMVHRADWLRAAVLGANDGLVSSASLVVGATAAGLGRAEILIAGLARLVAGAMPMAAGEHVSVGSQADAGQADNARETRELKTRRKQRSTNSHASMRREGSATVSPDGSRPN